VDQTLEITAVVTHCIDELNKQLPAAGRLTTTPDTLLVGDGGVLDSLGLITLFVSIEQELATKHAITCPLLDTLMSETDGNPMETIGSLVHWINQNANIGT